MLSEGQKEMPRSRALLLVLGLWAVVSTILMWRATGRIAERVFPDPDDAMRLMQVRDWMAGQSWFDVTQYRLNTPHGGAMHWSRWVDVPIAAVILAARPIFGQHTADTAALIIIPLLTLGAAMMLTYSIAAKLMDRSTALLAVLATPATVGAMAQMCILRIDHHGWQIIMALIAIRAALIDDPKRSGLLAGAAMGMWLNISLEGLPFATGIAAWFGLHWLVNGSHAERLKAYLAALAGATTLLFVLTHLPASWSPLRYDGLNVVHLAAFIVAWAGCQFGVHSSFTTVRSRFAVLAGAAIATLGTMFAIDPNCFQAPFGFLDPIVAQYWYNAVDEGQPIWRLPTREAVAAIAQSVVGLAGALLAVRKCAPERKAVWTTYAYLLGVSTLAAVLVVREATTSSVLSLPGTAFLCEFFLLRARKLPWVVVRIPATAGALCVMAPAYAVPAAMAPANPAFDSAVENSEACVLRSETEKLRFLPAADIAAPLDITPSILAHTRHRAIGSGHHRNDAGIRDVILLFIQSPDKGREIVARRDIEYVVICPRTPEPLWWASQGPKGLADVLNADKHPEWLEPVAVPGLTLLKVLRVRKDRLGAPVRRAAA
jgi:hypothetical protein